MPASQGIKSWTTFWTQPQSLVQRSSADRPTFQSGLGPSMVRKDIRCRCRSTENSAEGAALLQIGHRNTITNWSQVCCSRAVKPVLQTGIHWPLAWHCVPGLWRWRSRTGRGLLLSTLYFQSPRTIWETALTSVKQIYSLMSERDGAIKSCSHMLMP